MSVYLGLKVAAGRNETEADSGPFCANVKFV